MTFKKEAILNKKVAAAVVVLVLAVLTAFGKDHGPVCNLAQLAGLIDNCTTVSAE